MKSLFNRLAGVAVVGVVLYSCASIGRPEGGAIDETPPRFVGSTPAPGALNNNRKKITIEFDEFIKLEKPGEKSTCFQDFCAHSFRRQSSHVPKRWCWA